MSKVFDKTLGALSVSSNMLQLRQNLISSNVANAETPGFKAKKLDFEEALARAVDLSGLGSMSTSHADHIPVSGGSLKSVAPDVYENPDVEVSNDGNTVDLEREMAAMRETSLMYKAAIQLINKKLAALKYAATDGGRG